MKMNTRKMLLLGIVAILLPLFSACFTILVVDQKATVNAGETLTVNLEVRTESTDANAHHGILAVLVPNDWTVNAASYSGDFGPDEMSFLHPDSIDADPGGAVDYWNVALETNYPSGDYYQWIVYQANTAYASALDTGYVDVVVQMTVGNKNGNYKIGYFVTNAALDFTDPTYYSISLENPIEVTGGTDVRHNQIQTPQAFHLSQNYPNPFNPTTTIRIDLPESGVITLKVYNLLGEEVSTVLDGFVAAGSHHITLNAAYLQSGVYYYRLHAGTFIATKKMVLLQ